MNYNGAAGAGNYGNMQQFSSAMSQFPRFTAQQRFQMPNPCQPEMTPDAMTDFGYMRVNDPQQLYLQSLLHQQMGQGAGGMQGGSMQQQNMYQPQYQDISGNNGLNERRNGMGSYPSRRGW